jgi:hypothetical protein
VITLVDDAAHLGQVNRSGAVPIGNPASNGPQSGHRNA